MLRAPRATVLLVLLTTVAQAAGVRAPTAPALQADIPPQKLATALANFAEQTGLQYVSEVVQEQQSRGAHAGAAPARALGQLLKCTGLKFEFLNSRTAKITKGGRPAADDPDCTPSETLPIVLVQY